MEKVKNRWLIALSGVGIHICIGSAYAWSVFTNPMADAYGWSTSQISLAFSIAIFLLGFSAAFMGKFVEKRGPRISGMLSAIFFGIGVMGTGLATFFESLILLYFFYGIVGGIGLGIGYIAPVSTLVKWFPDHRGLATGLAIMGFGFASLISGPAGEALVSSVGISNAFYILGACYLIIMMAASQYLAPPPEDWKPEGMKDEKADEQKQRKEDLSQMTANEAIKTKPFWMLWTMLFLNVTTGIAIISVASPIGQEITGMSAVTAATMVGVMGLFNGVGRLGWATISDYIGRPNVYTIFFTIGTISYFTLPVITSVILFQILVFAIVSCYGGGFASVPAYIGDLFGTKQLGAIHGYILTAWAVAGVVGPMLLSLVYDATNSYQLVLLIFGGMHVVSLIISLWIRVVMRQMKKEKINMDHTQASQL
ncbi:MFS transporter, OFA family, oxalate/formate antiporter [Lentibacillus halodurans]|uniref:MFS transporter, OFA family, oxalate/formate antiporter n=1 Tax=Lentibacillus halodurans TaxID=237679 RepID=A0A1I1AAT9_9BACI|nr:OFA family MFS transporter [Lentibacillus halodurans]SFB35064.1 MFS transporter, OFA family, oxalate/formate antiporter [Lentibacillus halodurans]